MRRLCGSHLKGRWMIAHNSCIIALRRRQVKDLLDNIWTMTINTHPRSTIPARPAQTMSCLQPNHSGVPGLDECSPPWGEPQLPMSLVWGRPPRMTHPCPPQSAWVGPLHMPGAGSLGSPRTLGSGTGLDVLFLTDCIFILPGPDSLDSTTGLGRTDWYAQTRMGSTPACCSHRCASLPNDAHGSNRLSPRP